MGRKKYANFLNCHTHKSRIDKPCQVLVNNLSLEGLTLYKGLKIEMVINSSCFQVKLVCVMGERNFTHLVQVSIFFFNHMHILLPSSLTF